MNAFSRLSSWLKSRITPVTTSTAPPPVVGGGEPEHFVKWTTFADPADVKAFRRCKATGKSDEECFKVGDNGIGHTGLNCADASIPYVALPEDYWKERFGTKGRAKGAKLSVTINGQTKICILGDTMPLLKDIKNGAGLDLAPGACKLFGLPAGSSGRGSWSWV
jgi:hypothetical protein